MYWVTQLRTDGVHCRESAGTGSVVLNVVPVTGAAFSGITIDQLVCAYPSPRLLIVFTVVDMCVYRRAVYYCRIHPYTVHLHLSQCPYTAISVSVQCKDVFFPDVILLTLCDDHRGIRLNPM